jgi:tRNA nucleotidyltransferase (CCA-adding enzyme)
MEWGIFHEMHPDIVELSKTAQEEEWHPEGNVWIHTLMVVDEAAKIIENEGLKGNDALLVMLGAFCHDFGKPSTTKEIDGRIKSLGHEEAGREPAIKFLSEIGIEASIRVQVARLVAAHLMPSVFYIQDTKKAEKITDGAIKRLAARVSPATLKHLVCVAKADHLGRGPFVDPTEPEKSFIPLDYPAGDWLLQKASQLGVYENKPQPVIFGRDLISLGLQSGKHIGEIIKCAEEMHVRGLTREKILMIISSIIEEGRKISDIVSILEKEYLK